MACSYETGGLPDEPFVFLVPCSSRRLPPVRLLDGALLLGAQGALPVGVDLRRELTQPARAGLHLLAAPALEGCPVGVGEAAFLGQAIDDEGEQLAPLLGLQLDFLRAVSFLD